MAESMWARHEVHYRGVPNDGVSHPPVHGEQGTWQLGIMSIKLLWRNSHDVRVRLRVTIMISDTANFYAIGLDGRHCSPNIAHYINIACLMSSMVLPDQCRRPASELPMLGRVVC